MTDPILLRLLEIEDPAELYAAARELADEAALLSDEELANDWSPPAFYERMMRRDDIKEIMRRLGDE